MFRRRAKQIDEFREFSREVLARMDRNLVRWEKKTELQREESRRYFETLYAQGERENKRIDDLIAENRAQREALFRILDRLDNGGTAPAT